MKKIPITSTGHSLMQEELKKLKAIDRPAIIKAIADAREHGDLSENAEYHAARDRQSFIEGRVAELEDRLSRAQVIDVKKLDGDKVVFGAIVTLIDEDTEVKSRYQIVGPYEADIAFSRLSFSSPLAKAVIGKRAGDSVEVSTPSGPRYYEIAAVAFE